FRGSRVSAARIEEEVVVAVVERTVLDDVVLCAVDAANAEGQVPEGLIFHAGSILIDCLRPQTRIHRRSVAPEIAEVDERGGSSRTVQPTGVDIEIGLHQVAAGANVDIERDRRLKEARVVSEEFAFARSSEIPDETEARLCVRDELVQLDIGCA